ncbi:hypothetical protein FHX08_005355 [Rhizobium sp. BK529]|nr:hypothetical protein [Rhizobium sp. BK529]
MYLLNQFVNIRKISFEAYSKVTNLGIAMGPRKAWIGVSRRS